MRACLVAPMMPYSDAAAASAAYCLHCAAYAPVAAVLRAARHATPMRGRRALRCHDMPFYAAILAADAARHALRPLVRRCLRCRALVATRYDALIFDVIWLFLMHLSAPANAFCRATARFRHFDARHIVYRYLLRDDATCRAALSLLIFFTPMIFTMPRCFTIAASPFRRAHDASSCRLPLMPLLR